MGMTFVAHAQYDSHAPNIYLLHANLDFDDTRPNNVNYGISTPVLNSPDIGSTLARDPQNQDICRTLFRGRSKILKGGGVLFRAGNF